MLLAPTKQILHPGVGLAYDAVCQWAVVQPLLLSLTLRVVPVSPIPMVVLPRVPVQVLPVQLTVAVAEVILTRQTPEWRSYLAEPCSIRDGTVEVVPVFRLR